MASTSKQPWATVTLVRGPHVFRGRVELTDSSPERPSVLNMKERAKWDAWKALSGKPKADAESDYIRLVKSMLNKQPTGSDAPPAGAEPGWVSTCRKAAGDLWAYIKAQYAKVQDRIPFGTKNQA